MGLAIEGSLDQWNQFTNEFAMLDKVRMSGCYFLYDSDPVHVQVHGFSDASEHALLLLCIEDPSIVMVEL